MATGYTHPIKEHEGLTLGQFVWICARGFGALFDLREMALGEPIPPEAFGGSRSESSYHSEQIPVLVRRLAEAKAMCQGEAEARAAEDFDRIAQYRKERRERNELEGGRFRRMLAKVRAWEPPSSDHRKLKEFMISQIEETIEFECRDFADPEPVKVSGEEWRSAELERVVKDLVHHRRELARDEAAARDRREWLRALLESVPYEAPPK